ncbi:hypothetical protein KOI35_46975, partial [Actinoplanes bogorensis]
KVYGAVFPILYDKETGEALDFANNASLTVQSDYVPNDIIKIMTGQVVLPPQYDLTEAEKDAQYDGYDENVDMESQVDIDAKDGIDRTDLETMAQISQEAIKTQREAEQKYATAIENAKHKSEADKAERAKLLKPEKAST